MNHSHRCTLPTMKGVTHCHSLPATKPKEPQCFGEKKNQCSFEGFHPECTPPPLISIYLLYNYCIFFYSPACNNGSNLWSGAQTDERESKGRETRNKHSCQKRWRESEENISFCSVTLVQLDNTLADIILYFYVKSSMKPHIVTIIQPSHQTRVLILNDLHIPRLRFAFFKI